MVLPPGRKEYCDVPTKRKKTLPSGWGEILPGCRRSCRPGRSKVAGTYAANDTDRGSADRDDAGDRPAGAGPVAYAQYSKQCCGSAERPECRPPHVARAANAFTAASYEPRCRDQFAVVPVGAESTDEPQPVGDESIHAEDERPEQQPAEPHSDPVPVSFAESRIVYQQPAQPFDQPVGSVDQPLQPVRKLKQSKDFGEPQPIDPVGPFLFEQDVYIHPKAAIDDAVADESDALDE